VPEFDASANELKKIANLLALRQVRDLTKGEASLVLDMVGFSTKEIAALLQSSEGSIRGLLSVGRKKPAAD
jgi:DNA-directed RNA polymerase specialized sigma24 family protein